MTKQIVALGAKGSVLNCIVNEFLSSGLTVKMPVNCISTKSEIPTSSLCSGYAPGEIGSEFISNSIELIFVNLCQRLRASEQTNLKEVMSAAKSTNTVRFLVLVNRFSSVNTGWMNKIRGAFKNVIVLKVSIIFENLLVGLSYSNLKSCGLLMGGAYCISAGDIGRQLCNIIELAEVRSGTYFLQGPEIINFHDFTRILRRFSLGSKGRHLVRKLLNMLFVLRSISILGIKQSSSETFCSLETWRQFGKPSVSINGFLTKIQG